MQTICKKCETVQDSQTSQPCVACGANELVPINSPAGQRLNTTAAGVQSDTIDANLLFPECAADKTTDNASTTKKHKKPRGIFKNALYFFLFIIAAMIGIGLMAPDKAEIAARKAKEAHRARSAELFKKVLIDDFENSLDNTGSIVTASEWLGALGTAGFAPVSSIQRDFSRNEIKATMEYSNTYLVEGKVRGLRVYSGEPIVQFGTHNGYSVNALMTYAPTASNYKVGETVMVRCSGFALSVTSIIGNRCRDYADWIEGEISDAVESLSDEKQKIFNIMARAVSALPVNSPCYEDIDSKSCQAEFEQELEKLRESTPQ